MFNWVSCPAYTTEGDPWGAAGAGAAVVVAVVVVVVVVA